MDLNINRTSFSGKKEVLYGLKKAATLAKDYETTKIVYINSRMQTNKNKEQIANISYMSAYLDMVIRDSDFIKTVKNVTEQELIPIKKALKQENNEHGIINPMDKFIQIINQTVNNSCYGKARKSIKSVTNELLLKLKS